MVPVDAGPEVDDDPLLVALRHSVDGGLHRLEFLRRTDDNGAICGDLRSEQGSVDAVMALLVCGNDGKVGRRKSETEEGDGEDCIHPRGRHRRRRSYCVDGRRKRRREMADKGKGDGIVLLWL